MTRPVRIAITVLCILLAAAWLIPYAIGLGVQSAVSTLVGPVLGVPVHLDKAQFRPFAGRVRLLGFVLGNPEGFNTDHAIRVGEVTVDLDMKSIFKETLVIRRIYVEAPEIVYELGLGKSNLGRILEQLGGDSKAAGDSPEKPSRADGGSGGKKLVIDDFRIENARVRLSATLAMGAAAPIPLPDIHLTGIGREKGSNGASPAAVVRQLFRAIANAVTQAATGAAGVIGDGAKALGSGIGKMAGGVKNLLTGNGAAAEPSGTETAKVAPSETRETPPAAPEREKETP